MHLKRSTADSTLTRPSYQVSVKKERRRSIRLSVSFPNIIHIKAPYFVTQNKITEFINSKQQWIQNEFNNLNTIAPYLSYSSPSPSSIMYLGNSYPIIYGDQKKPLFKENSLHLPENFSSKQLVSWYKKRAKEIITDRAEYIASQLNLSFKELRIKDTKSRWGSCSARKNLNFNWKLILFKLEQLDYVVIHEVSHLKHLNHSKDFWNCVKSLQPNFHIHHQFFKDVGNILRA